MAETEQIDASSSRVPLTTRRTQARPKNSLFGTALEHIDKNDLDGIDLSQTSPISNQQPPERYPIPDHLQQQISARDIVAKARHDVKIQAHSTTDARSELREKELRALGFSPVYQERQSREKSDRGWLTNHDLEHSKDINIVGLGKNGSYNRDKYGNKPPTHNYSLIGDILSCGNDFGVYQSYDPDETLLSLNKQENNNTLSLGALRLGFNPKIDPQREKPTSAIKLPPNIRHQFGSRVCDNLLSDKKLVEETVKKQQQQPRVARAQLDVEAKDYFVKSSSSYFQIGHLTRLNVCPGITKPETESSSKAVHNDLVYLHHIPMTDKYRVRRDENTIWAAQNIVREKMLKSFNQPK